MSSDVGFAVGKETQTEKSKMTLEQLEEFVPNNKIPVTEFNFRDRCVDGRYEGDDLSQFPAVSKPGATAGDVLTAFGALNILGKQLLNKQVLEAVVDAEGGINKFCFHTDDHAEQTESGCGMGCGHIKLAKEDPVKYGLTQDQIDFLFAELPSLRDSSATQEILHGDHQESAVVVIQSTEFGLRPLWKQGGSLQEVFVYQKTLHEQQLDKLARKLQELLAASGEVVEEKDIRLALDEAFA
ncbi:MAG TPA: hypothetical protein PKD34_01130, partial [Candidatus Doudnabacteria bacterium]|nr:hypothetical protein [Candidatus Doudnabacteria bacterium]